MQDGTYGVSYVENEADEMMSRVLYYGKANALAKIMMVQNKKVWHKAGLPPINILVGATAPGFCQEKIWATDKQNTFQIKYSITSSTGTLVFSL